jgi:hypothetical protein
VTDVPEEKIGALGVGSEIEDVVESDGEFGYAEVAGEMSPILTDGLDDALADFGRQGG